MSASTHRASTSTVTWTGSPPTASSRGRRLEIGSPSPASRSSSAQTGTRLVKWTQEELTEVVTQYHEAGWQIAAKQITDESLDMALIAFGAVFEDGDDRRHRLEHALEMRGDQIPQVAALGLAPVIQLGGIEADMIPDPGFMGMVADDDVEAVWPFRDMITAGLPLVGSMAVLPVEGVRSAFTISVMQMLHGALTGISEVGNQPWPGRESQLVTIDEALEAITWRAAWSTFEEESRGALVEGMLADLVVMSRDLREARSDPEILKSINVAATLIGGELLWCGFDLDDWCAGFGQAIPERILEPSTLTPLQQGDLGSDGETPGTMVEGLTLTASASRDVHLPALAFDGQAEGESFWSSGADPPGWVQVDFEQPTTITALRFVVFQNPPGETVHVLEVLVGGVWSEVERFEGFTTTGDVLEWVPPNAVESVEGFRMTTLESPSWPEWYEIEINP
ncbi:MAG TPA: amidohydrolase family protein [Acidimicrobiia bacterium]